MSELDKQTAIMLCVLWVLAFIALLVTGYAMVVVGFPSMPDYGRGISIIVWCYTSFFAFRKLNYFRSLFLSAVAHDEHSTHNQDEGSLK